MFDLTPLWISLRIATIATAIAFILGTATAHWMRHYQGRWRSLIDSLLLAPMVLPPTVLGFVLLLMLGKNGPLGQVLDALGLSPIFTWYAAILTATVVGLPLMYKTVLGAFTQIDHQLQQAARTLGASEWRLFWQVTLPLALPGIVAGITLTFARALGEFGATLMLAGNIPGKTQTLPMAIYFAVEAGAFREAAVWTSIILTLTLGGLMLVNHFSTTSTSWPTLREQVFTLWTQPLEKRRPSFDPPHSGQTSARLGAPAWALPPHLSVTLVKRLPGFTLNVAFTSDRQPLGLLGASGAGKSLILRCIAGLETPDEGRIVLNGRVLFDSALGINLPSRERRVGVLFQNYALFPHLTVAENVAFGLPTGLSPQQRRKAVTEQLVAVRLQALGDRRPSQLSGGQQQRVALARLLASQPEVLLLDEPFSALDTHLRYLVERDLRLHLKQFRGMTLLVSHNIEEAYRICSRLLVMEGGRIAAFDTKEQVLERPQTVSAARLTGCKNISRAVLLDAHTVCALEWNCTLKVAGPLPAGTTHLGLRAHRIRFIDTLSKTIRLTPPTAEQDCTVCAIAGDASIESVAAAVETQTPVNTLATNAFPGWLVMTSETPHRLTLYIKLNDPPGGAQDYHLQAEVSKEKWQILKTLPLPWSVQLDPTQLLALQD